MSFDSKSSWSKFAYGDFDDARKSIILSNRYDSAQYSYTVTYHANNGTGTTASDSENTAGVNDIAMTIRADDNCFIYAHHTFQGWATSAGGEVEYAPGDVIILTVSINSIDLYAIWEEDTYYAPCGMKVVKGLSVLPCDYSATFELRDSSNAKVAETTVAYGDFYEDDDGSVTGAAGSYYAFICFTGDDNEGSLMVPAGTYALVETGVSIISGYTQSTSYYLIDGEVPTTESVSFDIPYEYSDGYEYGFTVTNTYTSNPDSGTAYYTLTVIWEDENGTRLDAFSTFIPVGIIYNAESYQGGSGRVFPNLIYSGTIGNATGTMAGDTTVRFVYRTEMVEIPEEIPLADLNTTDHYAYIVGRDDGLIHPEAEITRAEVATIFFRLLTDEARNSNLTTENDFRDVDPGDWFNTAVSTLSSMGIITGYSDGTFRPDANITRAEFAVFAARFDSRSYTSVTVFTDTVGHWAEVPINRAANYGWINGYEDNTFRPDKYIIRAEAVTLINKVLGRLPESVSSLLPDMKTWSDNMDTSKRYYLAIQEAANGHYYEKDSDGRYETWTELRETRDWTELEH